jgi:hypothetical protein
MARRTQWAAVFVALTPILAGCGSSLPVSPTAPTSFQSPAPEPTVAGERWNLTITLRAATGAQGCAVDLTHMHVGEPSNWLMGVERSGELIHLVVSDLHDPTYRFEYDGTVAEDVFTAAINTPAGAGWCRQQGGRVQFSAETHVSGRFSGDGVALTAEQVDSLQFKSGETLSLQYDWSATRQ